MPLDGRKNNASIISMNRNQLKRKARNVLQYYGEEVDKNRIDLFIDNRTEQEIDNMILEIKTLKRKKKEIDMDGRC
jgi:ribosomal protein L12E/L44/L45/RPP1/RPP2